MVRYYGYYSNVVRGKRKEMGTDDTIPCILEPVEIRKTLRKNWARLIQKIYEVDLLACPKCKGNMQIISFIEDAQVIRDILTHLGLWLVRSRPPLACATHADRPKIHTPTTSLEPAASNQLSHPLHPQADCYADPEYIWDDYIYPEGHTQS
jgi:uncharacterized protein YbaR (Trm112 family)